MGISTSNYQYQEKAAKSLVSMIQNQNCEAIVLAATPSAGKSAILTQVINSLVEKSYSQIIVFTHNQNILKDQMLENFSNGPIKANFTFGEFDTTSQVLVGIPASISSLNVQSIDLLVIDEAHEYYLGDMVQNFIQKYKPKKILLLTGSPGKFNKNSNYDIYHISAEDLDEFNVFSKVVVEIVKVNDYVTDVCESFKLAWNHLKMNNYNTDKVMIAVNTIEEANKIGRILELKNRKVAVSTSYNDLDSNMIKDFKNNKYDTLVVVKRGILGFSDNYITGIIDLRRSFDLDCRNQLLSRVLRKHINNVKKFYISVCNREEYNKEVNFLKKTITLMERDVFSRYVA